MARCPECQTEQTADFGMTTCTQCSAVFMVGIDGDVSSAESLPPEEDVPVEDVASYEAEEAYGEGSIESPYEPASEPIEEPQAEEIVEEVVADEEEEYSENFLDNLSDNKKPSTTDPLDIQRFDESASSQMDEGEYVYEVIITGIDSADLKKEVMMALSEKRFSLIVSELQKEIQKGELIVRNLNPVRAMLIVLRLQSLDIIVEWRQKHFTQEATAKKSEAEI